MFWWEWGAREASVTQLLMPKGNWEGPFLENTSSFKPTVMFCFPNTWWRYFQPPDRRSDFWPPLLAPCGILCFIILLCRIRERRGGKKRGSRWIHGKRFTGRALEGRQRSKSLKSGRGNLPLVQGQTGKSWEWPGLISELVLLATGCLTGTFPESWPIRDRGWCQVGLVASEQRKPGFHFQLCHKFHTLPWAEKPNPHASLLHYLRSSCLSVSSD